MKVFKFVLLGFLLVHPEVLRAADPNIIRDKSDLVEVGPRVTTHIEGTLRKTIWLKRFLGNPYPYYLADNKGRRVAWLSFSGSLMVDPVEIFQNKKVKIQGRINKGSKGLWIQVQNIYLKNY